jgi:hypothetical protein
LQGILLTLQAAAAGQTTNKSPHTQFCYEQKREEVQR